MCARMSTKTSNRAGQQAFEEIEGRDEAHVELGIDAAGQRQHRQRRRRTASTSASAQMKSGTASKRPLTASISGSPTVRRISVPTIATQPPSDDGEDQRRERELERRRQSLGQQLEHVAVQRDRRAEIAVHARPRSRSQNCDGKRRVEAVMGAAARRCPRAGAGRDHHRDRIAGHDAQQYEDETATPTRVTSAMASD